MFALSPIVTSLVITQFQILLLSQSAMANVRHAISAGKPSVEEKTQEDKILCKGLMSGEEGKISNDVDMKLRNRTHSHASFNATLLPLFWWLTNFQFDKIALVVIFEITVQGDRDYWGNLRAEQLSCSILFFIERDPRPRDVLPGILIMREERRKLYQREAIQKVFPVVK